MLIRRLLLVSLVLTTLPALPLGCAHLETNWDAPDVHGYAWDAAPRFLPLPHRYEVVPYAEFMELCQLKHVGAAGACARRLYAKNECVITSYAALDTYLDWHERKHCAGYNH